MNKTAIMKPLKIVREFKAPVERVFKAWTDPELMVQWWSPEDIECRDVKADPIVGGAYRIHMVSKDGNHTAYGLYKQIIPNKRLQFTWAWEEKTDFPESVVTVEFENLGKSTRLTLIHEGIVSQEEREGHASGWTTCLEKRFAPFIEEDV